ncbi:MAG: hypothetical protein PHF84_07210 [bacterium]|nr:hypothetical protein [bacterium]
MKAVQCIILFYLFFLLLVTNGPVKGAYEDTGMGARSMGLAQAYTGLADDVNAVYYNPAGLGQLAKNELSLDFSKLYWDLENDNLYNASLGLSIHSMDWGTFSLAWKMFYSELYQENQVFFSYGQDYLSGLLKLKEARLYSGVTVKLLQKSYKYNGYVEMDPVFDSGTSKLGVTGDAGLLYSMNNGLSLGVSCANFTGPDMGLMEKSVVPIVFRTGLAFLVDRLLYEENKDKWFNHFSVLADYIYRNEEQQVCGGCEFSLFRILSLRCGYGYGTDKLSRLASGIGFCKTYRYPSEIRKAGADSESYSIVEVEKSLDIIINYAFTFSFNGVQQDTAGNHYLELGVKF